MLLVQNNSLLKYSDRVFLPNQTASRTQVFSFTDGGHDWAARPDVVKHPNGTVIAFWCEATSHSDVDDRIWNINFSDDDGATFTANNVDLLGNPMADWPFVASAPDATGIGDMQLIVCENSDLILISIERVAIGTPGYENGWVTHYLYRSTDEGLTWDSGTDLIAMLPGSLDPTRIWACYTHTVMPDGTIIIPFSEAETDVDGRTRQLVYKSTDSGFTWMFVSYFLEYDDLDFSMGEPQAYELALTHLGGGRIMGVTRTSDSKRTFARYSEDQGATWGAIIEITEELEYVGVHQPKLTKFGDFLILTGRDVGAAREDVGVDATISRNGYWTSINNGATWTRRYLDPYYTGIGATNLTAGDSGYVTWFLRDDNTFLFFGYYGTYGSALLYKYEVNNTPTPSNEDYSNLTFNPRTISDDGIRLQMNRDYVTQASSGSPIVGLALLSRVRNSLDGDGGAVVLTVGGTNNPEHLVENNKGWCYFNESRVESSSALANEIFDAPFSGAVWLDPDDGQPAATQMILWANSSTTTTTGDAFQVQITTAGKIQVRYTEATVAKTALTDAAVFTDGSVTPKHVAWTVSVTNGIRIYIDGSLVTLDATSNGSMSGITMASWASTNPVYIGQRRNSATYDLSFVGKMREFILQPVEWTSGQVLDIMSN